MLESLISEIALFWNAPAPIEVTLAGISKLASLVVFANALEEIVVMVAPPLNLTEVSSVQPLNAPEPIEVTVLSNATSVSATQFWNAF